MTSDEKLIKAYEKTKKELEKKLKSAKAGTMKTYYRKLLKEVEESIKELQKSAAAYVNTAVPADYMENAAEIFEQMKAQNIIMKPPEAFRQLHTDAIYDLRREVMTQIEQGIAKAKEQTEKLAAEAYETAKKAALRSMGLDAAQHKIDTVGTITDMQREMVKRLEETGILKVEVGSGEHKREMSITNYAHLVARSTSREVGNTARINQMSANGFDLVEIPPHYPTCEICAILQDRVYSISGEDKRFPPLSKAIGAYKNIHPHCRHVIVGWAEMMYTPEEIGEAIKKSNRPWTDPRSGEEKQFYNELQKKNRQARDLQYQYERYKQRLGSDAPKSLYAFKRIKKAGGEKWEELQEKYRKAGVDNSVSGKYNKYIELPPEVKKIGGMTKETMEEISKAFDKLFAEYDLPISSSDIKCVSFGEGNDKQPFRFNPCKVGYSYRPSIEINLDYYFNDSLENFQARIMRNYNGGKLSSKNIEGLVSHEIAHVLTFNNCKTWEEFEDAEWQVRLKYTTGVSEYADVSHDGAETIAEGFVRIRNGENVPDKVKDLVNQYVERWKKL